MAANSVRPDMVPSAPVNGGMRWRTYYHDLMERCRGLPGFDFCLPDAAADNKHCPPEPELPENTRIDGIPPTEARAAEIYCHQPRASDGVADGFTWYLEKSPPGMTVDRHSGKVNWMPAQGGYVDVVLCARSVYGTTARQAWTICVHKAVPVRVFTANTRFLAALRRKKQCAAKTGFIVKTRYRAGVYHWPASPPPWTEWRRRVAVPLRN